MSKRVNKRTPLFELRKTGYVRVKGLIGRNRDATREVEFFVETGSFYTIVPPDLAGELGIESYMTIEMTLADRREVKCGLSLAYMKLLDGEGGLFIAILNAPEPPLGATALEGLDLMVDPSTGKLEHSRPYGLAAL